MSIGYPKYMIEVDDNRPNQIKDKLRLGLQLRSSYVRNGLAVCHFFDAEDGSISWGLNITSVNGTPIPDAMAVTDGDYIVGFRLKNGPISIEDFDFKVNKKK